MAYGGCEVREEAVEVLKLKENMDIYYAQAVKVVQRERREKEISKKEQTTEVI